jgi:hypothetical protein
MMMWADIWIENSVNMNYIHKLSIFSFRERERKGKDKYSIMNWKYLLAFDIGEKNNKNE